MNEYCIGFTYKNIIPEKLKTFSDKINWQKKFRKKNPLKKCEDNINKYWNDNALKELFVNYSVQNYFPEKIFIQKQFSPVGYPRYGYYNKRYYKKLKDLNYYELKVMKQKYNIN